MGHVYLAKDNFLNNSEVALKFLKLELGEDKVQVERFLREVMLTRKVTSPYVVQTYDANIHEGQLYFAMEHVDGTVFKG